jgi:hypothetical protein
MELHPDVEEQQVPFDVLKLEPDNSDSSCWSAIALAWQLAPFLLVRALARKSRRG